MPEMPRVKRWTGWVVFFVMVFVGAATRFQHPEMTETQLFIIFWLRWVVLFGLFALTMLWLH